MKSFILLPFLFILLAVAGVNAQNAQNATYYVTTNGNVNVDGTAPDLPTTLQEALANANLANGDTIKVAAGTYVPTVVIPTTDATTNRDQTFYINKNIALLGGYNDSFTEQNPALYQTTLSGKLGNTGAAADSAYHVMVWNAPVVADTIGLIEGFIFRDGRANGTGDISADGVTQIYRSVGGALCIRRGELTVSRNVYTGNYASSGGAISVREGTATFSRNTFAGNRAISGGGVYNVMGTLTLYQNTFMGNSATNGGGVLNNTFTGALALYRNTFTGNSATNGGGGVSNGGTLTLYQNTLTGNSAKKGGGVSTNGTMTYGGNILAGNKAADDASGHDIYFYTVGGGTLTSSGYNLIGEGGAITSQGDPILPDPSDHTVALANLPSLLDGTVANGLFTPNLVNGSWVKPIESGMGTLNSVPVAQLQDWNHPTNAAGDYLDQRGVVIDRAGGTHFIGSVNFLQINNYYVNADAPAGGNGSLSHPYRSLGDALSNPTLTHGDTVRVAAGTYVPTEIIPTLDATTDRDKTFYINKNIALLGSYNDSFTEQDTAAYKTILSGKLGDGGLPADSAYHIMVWNAPVVADTIGLIEGFTFLDGRADGTGSISADGVNSISRNTGGALCIRQGELTVSRNVYAGNYASSGGAISVREGTATFSRNTFTGNSADIGGGGVANAYGTLTLYQNTLTGNSAEYGGGVANGATGTLTLYQNTFTGNSANKDGGGIHNFNNGNSNSILTLYQNTLTGNSAADYGGGVYNYGIMTYGGNIIAGNKAADDTRGHDFYWFTTDGSTITSFGYNLIGEGGAAAAYGTFPFDPSDRTVALAALPSILDGTVNDGLFVSNPGNPLWVMPLKSGKAILRIVPAAKLTAWVPAAPDGKYYDQRGVKIDTQDGFYCAGSVSDFRLAPPVYHTITFTVPTGLVMNPASTPTTVSDGSYFTFYLEPAAGYENFVPSITVNGQRDTLFAQVDGTGWVRKLGPIIQKTDIVFTFTNPVGNLNPDAPRLYTADGTLFVDTPIPVAVSIYSTIGQLVTARRLPEGTTSFTLSKGVYLIRIDKTVHKIVVR